MQITFAAAQTPADVLIIPFWSGAEPIIAATNVDAAVNEAASRALAASRFTAEAGQTLVIAGPANVNNGHIVALGLGEEGALSPAVIERAAAAVVKALSSTGAASAALVLSGVAGVTGALAAHAGFGARLAAYRFDAYRTTQKPADLPALNAVGVITDDVAGAEAAWAGWAAVADGVYLARDLVSEPPNVLHPETFADRVAGLADAGLQVEVLGEAEMEALGLRTLLGVGQGSVRESKLAIMRWNGADDDSAPLAFIGKGVTFDTGGISIKPGPGMEDMKGDMGGAAAVTGLMRALAGRKAKVNAIGMIGLVENMPDGNAQRPGDIVTTYSGQTVEILNTDAEGRLVLADVLWYCQERFKPRFMVDLATLTGAIVIALSHHYAGLFSNDDELAGALFAAGEASEEKVWRLPLGPEFDKQLDSKFADMQNIGGKEGGSITAAQFLQRYTNGVPWAHLDIASTAWKPKNTDPREPAWATGFGVRLLDRFVRDGYETT